MKATCLAHPCDIFSLEPEVGQRVSPTALAVGWLEAWRAGRWSWGGVECRGCGLLGSLLYSPWSLFLV